jgi:hypothetical protein
MFATSLDRGQSGFRAPASFVVLRKEFKWYHAPRSFAGFASPVDHRVLLRMWIDRQLGIVAARFNEAALPLI